MLKEHIADMLNQLASGDNTGAYETLNSILTDKAEAALENMRVDVADQMFGGVKEEVEQIDEISVGLAARTASVASDPDYVGNANPNNIARMAGKKFGKKIGDQIADADKGHYPREYGSQRKQVKQGYDKLAWRQNRSTAPTMTTKDGKLTKTAQKGLKSDLKG